MFTFNEKIDKLEDSLKNIQQTANNKYMIPGTHLPAISSMCSETLIALENSRPKINIVYDEIHIK